MFEAVLIDLDNTLILYDEKKFFKKYFHLLTLHFADLMPPDSVVPKVLQATQSMIKQKQNDDTNLNYFLAEFSDGDREKAKMLWQRFLSFYNNEFSELKEIMQPVEGITPVINHLQSLPIKRVVATNPVFPLIAQEKRLHWATVPLDAFDLITHIGNTTRCKPSPQYYLQISYEIGVAPEKCLMIGNDPVNDLAAAEVGMKTYLATDSFANEDALSVSHSFDENAVQKITPDFQGPFKDVVQLFGSAQ